MRKTSPYLSADSTLMCCPSPKMAASEATLSQLPDAATSLRMRTLSIYPADLPWTVLAVQHAQVEECQRSSNWETKIDVAYAPIQSRVRSSPAICRRCPTETPREGVARGAGLRSLTRRILRPPRIARIAAKSCLMLDISISHARGLPKHRHDRKVP